MHCKLAFYSDQIPGVTDDIDAKVLEWLPQSGGRIGYIPSSADRQHAWFERQSAYYARYGLTSFFFGLEDEFDTSLRRDLFACDAIHLTGGNTFQFLYWLRARDMIDGLRQYVGEGGVLIGVSAGAILMTPDIRTSLLCGDVLYPGLNDYTGLSLVDFAVVPHYDGTPAADEALGNFRTSFSGAVYTIPDGSGIIVDGCEVAHMAKLG